MYTVVFLLTPEFCLTNVATAIDTLRVANSLLAPTRSEWQIEPARVGAMPTRCGVTLAADVALRGGLVMGFGSDAAMGATMLGDLSRLDLATGTWSEVQRTGDLDPGKRGFALWLPGPEGSAGLLSGGMEDLGISKQAFVLQPPVTTGDWR